MSAPRRTNLPLGEKMEGRMEERVEGGGWDSGDLIESIEALMGNATGAAVHREVEGAMERTRGHVIGHLSIVSADGSATSTGPLLLAGDRATPLSAAVYVTERDLTVTVATVPFTADGDVSSITRWTRELPAADAHALAQRVDALARLSSAPIALVDAVALLAEVQLPPQHTTYRPDKRGSDAWDAYRRRKEGNRKEAEKRKAKAVQALSQHMDARWRFREDLRERGQLPASETALDRQVGVILRANDARREAARTASRHPDLREAVREALLAASEGEEPAPEEVDAELVRALGRIQEDRRAAKERRERRKKERAAKEQESRPATPQKEVARKEEGEEQKHGDAAVEAVHPMEMGDDSIEILAPADDHTRPEEEEQAEPKLVVGRKRRSPSGDEEDKGDADCAGCKRLRAAREADWAEFRTRAAAITAEARASREAATVADEAREEAEAKLEVALSNADAAGAHAYKKALDADFAAAMATFERSKAAALADADEQRARADRAEKAVKEATQPAAALATQPPVAAAAAPVAPVAAVTNSALSIDVANVKKRLKAYLVPTAGLQFKMAGRGDSSISSHWRSMTARLAARLKKIRAIARLATSRLTAAHVDDSAHHTTIQVFVKEAKESCDAYDELVKRAEDFGRMVKREHLLLDTGRGETKVVVKKRHADLSEAFKGESDGGAHQLRLFESAAARLPVPL